MLFAFHLLKKKKKKKKHIYISGRKLQISQTLKGGGGVTPCFTFACLHYLLLHTTPILGNAHVAVLEEPIWLFRSIEAA